jgi:glycine/D-amino acid oxidase-like deaminating enzyme
MGRGGPAGAALVPLTGKRVAVVGSGLAGLATAYLLRREGAEVWLIEKV